MPTDIVRRNHPEDGDETANETHHFGIDVGTPQQPAWDPHVLKFENSTDKADLKIALTTQVILKAGRPEVSVSGKSKLSIEPGSYMAAYDYTDPNSPVLLVQEEPDSEGNPQNAEWEIE